MKKLFVTILALVYLTSSSGGMVNLHYCMGKLMSWDLAVESKNKCGTCGMEKSGHKSCCHDEHKFYKLSDSHKNVSNNLSFAGAGISVVSLGAIFQSRPPVHTPKAENNDYSPPYDTGPSPIIMHCTFRK